MGYISNNNNSNSSSGGDSDSKDGDDDGGGRSRKAVSFDYLLQVEFILGYMLAVCGIIFQLFFGFSLPFPLNVLLFPITIIEYILVWIINNSSNLYASV